MAEPVLPISSNFTPPDVSVILQTPYMLDALLILKRGGSLTDAARAVHKQRNTLTEKLVHCEKKLGFTIYNRKGFLTDHGEYLVMKLLESRRLIEEAALGIQWVEKEVKEEVFVCVSACLIPIVAPTVVKKTTDNFETHFYMASRPESISLESWSKGQYDVWVGNEESLPAELLGPDTEIEFLRYPKPCYWCDRDHPLTEHVAEDGKIYADAGILQSYPCIAPVGIPDWWEKHWLKWLFDLGVPLGNYTQTSPLHVFSSNDEYSLEVARREIQALDGGIAAKRDFLGDRVVEVVLEDEPEYEVGRCFVAWRNKENPDVAELARAVINAISEDNNIRWGETP